MVAMTSVIGIGLKLVANREKIVQAWGQIAPIIKQVREAYPQIRDLIDDIAPGVTEPDTSESYSVEWLQKSLNTLDNADLEIDGEYGDATKQAVSEFQSDHPPLVVDGWAGVSTQAAIVEELARN